MSSPIANTMADDLSKIWKPKKGEIAWLPSQEVYLKSFIAAGCLDREYLTDSTKLVRQDPEAFLHPVVISSVRNHTTDSQKVLVKFHTILSFGERSLVDKFGEKNWRAPAAWERNMLQYAALSPAKPHPVTGKVLSFKNGKRMRKGSYIKLAEKYQSVGDALTPYFGHGQAGCLVLIKECIDDLEAAYEGRLVPPKAVQTSPPRYSLPSPGLYTESPNRTPVAAPTAGVYGTDGYWYPQGYQYGYQNTYPYGYNYDWQYQYQGQPQVAPPYWQVPG